MQRSLNILPTSDPLDSDKLIIVIAANENITNSGTLVLQAADILNQEAIAQGAKIMTRHSGWSGTYAQVGVGGGVLSGNSVVAVAENSITNAAGQIISGAGGTTLLAGSKVNADGSVTYLNNGGTISNTSLKLVDGSGYYMNGFHYDNAAMVSGGNTTLVASNMIIQQGSMIASQGDITLLAQNGISTDASTGKVELGKRYWSPLMEASSVTSATGSVDGKAELGDITVKGTALAAANDIALTAGQNIDIDAAIQSYTQKTKSSGFSGLSYSSTTTKSALNAVQISSLEAGNDITLNAGNDLTMKGALLNAGNDIALKAVGDITLTQQQVTNSVKTSGFSVGLTGLGAQVVNAALTGGDIKDAVINSSPLLSSLKNLSNTQSGLDLAPAMTVGINGVNAFNQIQGGADPMTALFGGPSAGVRFGTSKSSSTWTQSYRSGLTAGGNITVASGGDVNLGGGTSLNAGNNISLTAAQNLNIEAGADTNSSKSSSSGVSVSVNGGGFGAGVDGSKASSNGTSYTNASITAGNDLTFTSGADTSITGANLTAETITGNVGGNLALASVQNESSSKNSSFGVNVATSGAFSGSVASGNANRTFTDNQSSIIGSESVDITVKNNTDIKGAVIANVDENGVDQGNLKLTTATLTTSDLQDSDKSKQVGISVAVSGDNKDINGNQVGAGILGNNATGSYDSTNTQGVSKATIGNGEIITGSDISGMNRDVANAQIITKKDETHVSAVVAVPEQIAQPIREGSAATATAVKDDVIPIANHVVLDIVPLPSNHGGLIAKLATIDEGNKEYLIVRGGQIVGSKTLAELQTDSSILQGTNGTLYVTKNGIMNSPQEALANGLKQSGQQDFIIAYSPNHGLAPDLIDVGWNKFFGNSIAPTGNTQQDKIFDKLALEQNNVVNFFPHSAGVQSMYLELLQLPERSFSNANIQFSGGPVNEKALKNATSYGKVSSIVIQNNYGDAVPNLLGANVKDPLQTAWNVLNIPTLFIPALSQHKYELNPSFNGGIPASSNMNNQ